MFLQPRDVSVPASVVKCELHGLNVSAPFGLSPVRPRGDIDVRVCFDTVPVHESSLSTPFGLVSWTQSHSVFSWPGLGLMRVSDGRRITIAPVQGTDPDLWRTPVLVYGIPAILRQRGLPILHASVVSLAGHAVAFAGVPGAGKSTTGGGMIRRGASLVSDDICPITAHFSIPPGPIRLKLLPDSLTGLGVTANVTPSLWPGDDKREWDPQVGTCDPVPLRAVYVLERTDHKPRIFRLPPAEAVSHLVRHMYDHFVAPPGSPQALLDAAHLARSIPVFLVTRPPTLSHLTRFLDMVEDHMRNVLSWPDYHTSDYEGLRPITRTP